MPLISVMMVISTKNEQQPTILQHCMSSISYFKWKTLLKYFLYVTCLIGTLLYLIYMSYHGMDTQISKANMKSKNILLYAKLRFDPARDFKLINCPFKCDITTNKSLITLADAVVFPPMFMYMDMNKSEDKFTFPDFRQPHQLWVYFLYDRYYVGYFDLLKNNIDVFNISMTWAPDADIHIGYGHVEPVKYNSNVEDWQSIISNKTDLVLWVVSHCKTPSKREIYVQELSKHIQIDTYGKCGKKCDGKWNSHECFEKMNKMYKFYLAFENSICKDYVTEKLFRTLEYNMIPVVLGGTNYSQILPPKSFIDVQDFKTPKHLADYLMILDKDEVLYKSYFEWKKYYKVYHTSDDLPQRVCDLCKLLHTENPSQRHIPNITHQIMHDCNIHLISNWKKLW